MFVCWADNVEFLNLPLTSHAFSTLSLACWIICVIYDILLLVFLRDFHSSSLTTPPPPPFSFSSFTTTTCSLLSSCSSPQLNITSSRVEQKLLLPHIARLISRRHVRGWEHFIQQVTCGRLRRCSFKVVLSTEACVWSSLDYFTECGGERKHVCLGRGRETVREIHSEGDEYSWVSES